MILSNGGGAYLPGVFHSAPQQSSLRYQPTPCTCEQRSAQDYTFEALRRVYCYAWRVQPVLDAPGSKLVLPPQPGLLVHGCYYWPQPSATPDVLSVSDRDTGGPRPAGWRTSCLILCCQHFVLCWTCFRRGQTIAKAITLICRGGGSTVRLPCARRLSPAAVHSGWQATLRRSVDRALRVVLRVVAVV